MVTSLCPSNAHDSRQWGWEKGAFVKLKVQLLKFQHFFSRNFPLINQLESGLPSSHWKTGVRWSSGDMTSNTPLWARQCTSWLGSNLSDWRVKLLPPTPWKCMLSSYRLWVWELPLVLLLQLLSQWPCVSLVFSQWRKRVREDPGQQADHEAPDRQGQLHPRHVWLQIQACKCPLGWWLCQEQCHVQIQEHIFMVKKPWSQL